VAGASSSAPGPAIGDPATVVTAYFSAITAKRYARAWELGGVNTGTGSYGAFVAGFATTASDQVTILSVSGNVVTARLTALHTDGSAHTFKGTYTVAGGAIVQFDVQQIS
jgi:eukaryotic-like serine/threonine-protein kinase